MAARPQMNKAGPTENRSAILRRVLPVVIALITFLCYHYSLGNHFTNWDDERFIPDNIFIKSFSHENLKMMLFHDVTGDYYNPLTILSYAVNYHFSGVDPEAYYLTNIIIHILNSYLVFFLVIMLLNAMEKTGYSIFKWKEWLAFFCTLAYAIHPMHVESVSWAAERKDVLYAFFYFLGMIMYVKYIAKSNGGTIKVTLSSYFLVLSCFILALLSKPMAIVFPFSLLTLDVLLKRDKTTSYKKIVIEKLPFIAIAILSAISTFYAARTSGAVQEHQAYSLFQRILFASYGFYIYILKAFLPLFQSSFYPYPEFTSADGGLPVVFYLSPLIALIVIAIPLYLSYRAGKDSFRVVLFGLVFYFFNMIIVSQIIGSGPNIMADRYSYVCYFGIFFPLTYFIYKILERGKVAKIISVVFVSVYMIFYGVLCYERTLVWHDSQSLWTNVITQFPHRVVKAYNNLGNYYFLQFQISNSDMDFNKAYTNYKEAIDLKTGDPQIYCNMGSLLGAKKDYKSSLRYFNFALAIDSNDSKTYLDRAVTYSAMGNYDLAIKDYRHSAKINPNSEILYRNIAFTYYTANKFDSAIAYYSKVIQINPTNPAYFHYRGVAEYDKGDITASMEDFKTNLRLAPDDGECMFYISIVYNRNGDFDNAYKYVQMAQKANYAVPEDYLRLLKARLDIK